MDNQELIENTMPDRFEILQTENFCENVIRIENTDEIEIFGTSEQRQEMFEDWASYFGEVTNPDNTTLNTFFKAKYAAMGEVLNTIRPVMGKYGLAMIQTPYMSNGDVCVKTLVTHKSGAIIAFPQASGKPTKNDIQGFGSTTSYLRRFVANSIAGVFGEIDDDGNSISNNKNKETQMPKEPTKEELELKEKQEEILKSATEQIEKGIDKELVYQVISDNNSGKKNPNAIKDIDIANKVLAEIKKLKITKKDKKTEENVSE